MKFALIVLFLSFFQVTHAKVAENQPTVETPNLQAEIMDELETASEDIEFDTEDEIFLSSDEGLILDPEIENLAVKKAAAPKMEAKSQNKETATQKK